MNKIGFVIAFLFLLILYIPIFPAGFWINPPTGSMRPFMEGCDISFYGPGEPSEGDVMMYWNSDTSLIMHRVVEVKDDGYVFKGDNRKNRDKGLVNESQIQAEIYWNFDVPIDRPTCADITRTPYNLYYDLVGSPNYNLTSSSVNKSGLE